MADQPQAKYRADYQAPEYTITDIALDFDLHDTAARIVAVSQVKRLAEQDAALKLDGDALTLIRVEVNGEAGLNMKRHQQD